MLLHGRTPILVQGITGREARMFTSQAREYGANIVAGVTPGKGGDNVDGIPVYDTVREAVEHHRIEATLVSVPAVAAADAAIEAVAAGIPLLVITTERMTCRQVSAVLDEADAAGVTVIGPNSLGIMVPGETRIGAVGGSADQARRWYLPGRVAILSRSGGMMTEIAALLTQAGIGQRICISVGGDPLIGSSFAQLYDQLAAEPSIDAIVIFGEPGGTQEEELARRLQERPGRCPVVAFVAGRFADRMHGIRFGHAAAIVNGSSGSPGRKREVLAAAGALVADRLDDVPILLRQATAPPPTALATGR
ncbi:MAG: succinate--CoA ligase subunit alpha [Candidatus Dormibacteria bacterium]